MKKTMDIRDTFLKEILLPLNEHLDLETAIQYCVQALSNYMPAESMTIQLLEPALKSSRSVVWYHGDSADTRSMKNGIIALPRETRKMLKKSPLPDFRIINRPELDPVGLYFKDVAGTNFSNLVMFLHKEGKRFGVVVLSVEGRDKYTENDLALFSLLHEPFTMALINYLQRQEIEKLKQILAEQRDEKKQGIAVEDIVGHKFGLRNTVNLVQLVAPLDSPVLIYGETGVGKELIASAIHNASQRKDGPLISVNCGAIPETVVDSELFGHEKGAFTGAATQRKGRFERANHGTIFLDEVGELKPDIQVKLLRVLQSGELERVGGSEQIQVDVRIIAATHRNLDKMVSEGLFREDLLYRINVFPIIIPPLRTRKNDIPALVDHFVQKKSNELKTYPVPVLGNEAMDRLMNYHWPGNVRELENVVERELILHAGGPLTFANFYMTAITRKPLNTPTVEEPLVPLDDFVRGYLSRVLKRTAGQIGGPNGAAKILGLHSNTLRNKMIRLGIPFKNSKR